MRLQKLIDCGPVGSHRLLRGRCGGHAVWQWGSSVRRQRSRCYPVWQGMLPVYGQTGPGRGHRAEELVGQRERSLLHRLDLHHEALHIASISADFCTEPTRPSVLHCSVSDLGEPDRLPDHWILCIVPMLPKRKHLEPVGSGHMPQLWCHIGLRWRHQHHLRLFNSGPPSDVNMAITDGNAA